MRAQPIADAGSDPQSDVVSVPVGDRSPDLATTTGRAVRHEVVRLVRERKYEEALALLYSARAESPDSKELLASIQQIKEFLVGSYAKKLGGLDRVAGPLPSSAPRFPDALLVARYIDGVSTFDDIRRSCPLGQLRTLQVLVALYSGSPESIPPLRTETPPPPPVREASRSSSLPPDPSPEPLPETQRTREAPAREPAPEPSNEVRQWFSRPPPAAPSPIWPRNTGSPSPSVGPAAPSGGLRNVGSPSPSVAPPVAVAAPPESPEDAQFRAAFTRGTAAFIQKRYHDAIDAFRECERLRPSDTATATMLRRATREAQGT